MGQAAFLMQLSNVPCKHAHHTFQPHQPSTTFFRPSRHTSRTSLRSPIECKKSIKQKNSSRNNRSTQRGPATVDTPSRPSTNIALDAFEGIEVRGNQLILTMEDLRALQSASLARQDGIETQLDDEMHVMDAVVKGMDGMDTDRVARPSVMLLAICFSNTPFLLNSTITLTHPLIVHYSHPIKPSTCSILRTYRAQLLPPMATQATILLHLVRILRHRCQRPALAPHQRPFGGVPLPSQSQTPRRR